MRRAEMGAKMRYAHAGRTEGVVRERENESEAFERAERGQRWKPAEQTGELARALGAGLVSDRVMVLTPVDDHLGHYRHEDVLRRIPLLRPEIQVG